MGSALCSPVPMFPGTDVPRTYVPRYRCSPVPIVPGTYVPRNLCSSVPMFPEPMFPGTYVPRFTANVLNFACVRVHMCVCVCERACACACVCAWGRARLRAGVRAGVRVCLHISKLCRPLTHRQANYQSKNYYNHNNLQRQKG